MEALKRSFESTRAPGAGCMRGASWAGLPATAGTVPQVGGGMPACGTVPHPPPGCHCARPCDATETR